MSARRFPPFAIGVARGTRPTIATRFSSGEAVGARNLLRCAIVTALRRAQVPLSRCGVSPFPPALDCGPAFISGAFPRQAHEQRRVSISKKETGRRQPVRRVRTGTSKKTRARHSLRTVCQPFLRRCEYLNQASDEGDRDCRWRCLAILAFACLSNSVSITEWQAGARPSSA
jgi:hypothetical protein